MTEEMQELGRRAVAASEGRILQAPGARIMFLENGEWVAERVHADDEGDGLLAAESHGVPDLSDPATLGCLLALGAIIHKLSILPMGVRLVVEWPNGLLAEYKGKALGHVLVAALEAAGGDQ